LAAPDVMSGAVLVGKGQAGISMALGIQAFRLPRSRFAGLKELSVLSLPPCTTITGNQALRAR